MTTPIMMDDNDNSNNNNNDANANNERRQQQQQQQQQQQNQQEESQNCPKIQELERRIKELQNENSILKNKLQTTTTPEKEEEEKDIKTNNLNNNVNEVNDNVNNNSSSLLSSTQIERYSRQLLLRDGFGIQGQHKLFNSSVLVVGAGGIGSTVLLYLAACGVGKLTIIDYDDVEISNLHRQIIHNTLRVGMNKAESAKQSILELNPTINNIQTIKEPLTSHNAIRIINQHDCIIDSSDNPKTRYIINDACVLCHKTLVSGSSIGTEGQLTVYNYSINNNGNGGNNNKNEDDDGEEEEEEERKRRSENRGPCYRCLYPKPNTTEGCKSCSDNGVLGPVPGIIGTLQAIETIKVITGIRDVMYDRLVMYDSLSCSFMKIKKPPKLPNCPVCGIQPTIRSMEDSERESTTARGPSICQIGTNNNNNNIKLPSTNVISCKEYYNDIYSPQKKKFGDGNNIQNPTHILLDVRVKEQYDICSLDGSINIPLDEIKKQQQQQEDNNTATTLKKKSSIEELSNNFSIPIYCLCRRGIASAEATKILLEKASTKAKTNNNNNNNNATLSSSSSSSIVPIIKNISGGLDSWRKHVDNTFPKY